MKPESQLKLVFGEVIKHHTKDLRILQYFYFTGYFLHHWLTAGEFTICSLNELTFNYGSVWTEFSNVVMVTHFILEFNKMF